MTARLIRKTISRSPVCGGRRQWSDAASRSNWCQNGAVISLRRFAERAVRNRRQRSRAQALKYALVLFQIREVVAHRHLVATGEDRCRRSKLTVDGCSHICEHLVVPRADLIFYKEGDEVPILDWLKKVSPKVQDKCFAYLSQLEAKGHELRRPLADLLRDGIYELRPSYQGVHYRILYFFSGKDVVVVSHAGISPSFFRPPVGWLRTAFFFRLP